MAWIVACRPNTIFKTRAEARRYAVLLLIVGSTDDRRSTIKSDRLPNHCMDADMTHPHAFGPRLPRLVYASGSGRPCGS